MYTNSLGKQRNAKYFDFENVTYGYKIITLSLATNIKILERLNKVVSLSFLNTVMPSSLGE